MAALNLLKEQGIDNNQIKVVNILVRYPPCFCFYKPHPNKLRRRFHSLTILCLSVEVDILANYQTEMCV